jgi:hypothetical protein
MINCKLNKTVIRPPAIIMHEGFFKNTMSYDYRIQYEHNCKKIFDKTQCLGCMAYYPQQGCEYHD